MTFLVGARHRVRVIVPWFIDPLTVKESLSGVLGNRQASVEVFFLDPESPHLRERGRIARPDVDNYGPNETLRSLSVLGPAFAKAQASAKLFTYNSIPAAFIAERDDKALLGFHMHTAVALSNPIVYFDVRRDTVMTSLGSMIDREFDAVERIAREVDAASITSDPTGRVVFTYKPRA